MLRRSILTLIACYWLAWQCSPVARAADTTANNAADNAILKELAEKGVTAEARRLQLPPPSLPDGADAAIENAAWSKIADANHPLEALVRKSAVAPFVLRIAGDEEGAKTGTLWKLDLWFVAYGDLHQLSDETFLKSQVNAAPDPNHAPNHDANTGGILSAEDLRARGIDPPAGQKYLTARFALFDRVRISGTMQALLTRSPDSVLVAARLAPGFAKDRQFPNEWRPIARDESGRTKVGEPHPYDAVGWYVKATRLRQPPGAILVEYHAVFDEPVGWFNGANLLRSKLPIVVQDGVRKFRRQLAGGQRNPERLLCDESPVECKSFNCDAALRPEAAGPPTRRDTRRR